MQSHSTYSLSYRDMKRDGGTRLEAGVEMGVNDKYYCPAHLYPFVVGHSPGFAVEPHLLKIARDPDNPT